MEKITGKELITCIEKEQNITKAQLFSLLTTEDEELISYLHERARAVAQSIYGNQVYIRGLIEITNYCKNDCFYCGIRCSNQRADRYRLTEEEILGCCRTGYALGFRTFVLQGGEDPNVTDDRICSIVKQIREGYPDCAITLSLGEKSKESYQKYYEAGANRYLLRHETADEDHYKKLHPSKMSFKKRIQCLKDLKDIGFQVGCGFMVGSPYQTIETIYKDLQFIKELHPHMVGIGPFIPQKDTPFGHKEAGTLEMTLRLLSIIRLLEPAVLLPATTALGTIDPKGREMGILSGANVVMPNLSPMNVRSKYAIYDNKIHSGVEAAESRKELEEAMADIGYCVVTDRGDHKNK
jgi:biotin synthase